MLMTARFPNELGVARGVPIAIIDRRRAAQRSALPRLRITVPVDRPAEIVFLTEQADAALSESIGVSHGAVAPFGFESARRGAHPFAGFDIGEKWRRRNCEPFGFLRDRRI